MERVGFRGRFQIDAVDTDVVRPFPAVLVHQVPVQNKRTRGGVGGRTTVMNQGAQKKQRKQKSETVPSIVRDYTKKVLATVGNIIVRVDPSTRVV